MVRKWFEIGLSIRWKNLEREGDVMEKIEMYS